MNARTAMAAAIAEVSEWNAYMLASSDRADCASPDSLESDGARMLTFVRDATLERMGDCDDPTDIRRVMDDATYEIADSAPSVYTHAAWSQFVDLGAFYEDITEYGDIDGENITRDVAMRALYMIADRLARAIVEYVADAIESADDDDDDDDSDDN
jgi:hypothetical protein